MGCGDLIGEGLAGIAEFFDGSQRIHADEQVGILNMLDEQGQGGIVAESVQCLRGSDSHRGGVITRQFPECWTGSGDLIDAEPDSRPVAGGGVGRFGKGEKGLDALVFSS